MPSFRLLQLQFATNFACQSLTPNFVYQELIAEADGVLSGRLISQVRDCGSVNFVA